MSTYRSAQPHRRHQPGDAASTGSSPEETLPASEAPRDEPVASIAVSEPNTAESSAATTSVRRPVRTGLRERLTIMREKTKEERRRRDRHRREGFRWYEREWESRFWARRLGITPRAIVSVALVIVVSLFVFLIAARAATRTSVPGSASTTHQDANPIIIQQEGSDSGGTGSNLTPTLPNYTLGMWVSSMSPAASGSVQLYVRVTEDSSTAVNEPVSNVKVQVTSPYGVARSTATASGRRGARGDTATTDANGLVIFTFFYGAVPGTPVYVFATVTIQGHQISSNTVFVVA